MKSPRRWLVFGAFGLAVVLLLVWAFRSPENEIPDLHDRLSEAAASAGIGGTIALSDVVATDWDRAYVFPPYNDLSSVEEMLGFAWSPMSPAMTLIWGDLFLAYDGLYLIVFVSGTDGVNAWSIVGNFDPEATYLEFGENGAPLIIDRDSDTLRIEQPPFGPEENAYLFIPTAD